MSGSIESLDIMSVILEYTRLHDFKNIMAVCKTFEVAATMFIDRQKNKVFYTVIVNTHNKIGWSYRRILIHLNTKNYHKTGDEPFWHEGSLGMMVKLNYCEGSVVSFIFNKKKYTVLAFAWKELTNIYYSGNYTLAEDEYQSLYGMNFIDRSQKKLYTLGMFTEQYTVTPITCYIRRYDILLDPDELHADEKIQSINVLDNRCIVAFHRNKSVANTAYSFGETLSTEEFFVKF